MKKPEKMIVYNLFPPLAGRLKDWGPHIKRASDMGFNWLFLNPIQQPGFSGSLYSIKDYFAVNRALIDPSAGNPEEQVAETIKGAEALGMRTMVDLVINHCAVDSPLLKEHPEWFAWERRGKVVHPFCMENGKKVVWGDLAKFDHEKTKDKEGLYRFVSGVVEFLASLGVKGYRCDAAYQIPGGLWKRLIKETRQKRPDVLFFAETLGCTPDQTRKTASAGFDYIFNSSKWWDMRSPWLLEQYALTRDIAPSIGFPESHDTKRLAEEYGGNINALKQRYFFAALFSAGVMITTGYEYGFRKKTHVVETKPEDWEKTAIDLSDYIREVNGIKSSYRIFQEDAPTEVLHHGDPSVLVMWKASITTREEALIVINKDVDNGRNFKVDSLGKLVQSGKPLMDVSPEGRMQYIPEPFSYDLRPGQGLVFVTERNDIKK